MGKHMLTSAREEVNGLHKKRRDQKARTLDVQNDVV